MEQASHSSQGTVQVACSAASSPACSSFTQLHQQDLPSFVHSYMLPACNAATTLHSCSSQCNKLANNPYSAAVKRLTCSCGRPGCSIAAEFAQQQLGCSPHNES